MHLNFADVNDAFQQMCRMLIEPIPFVHLESSRNGDVYRFTEPMAITYRYPFRRVLLYASRDANPFFHLYEALWMLAGRNDVAPLAYYNARIAEYSDDGKVFNGAYGYRWKHGQYVPPSRIHVGHSNVNQLGTLINHLQSEPGTRRAVLQMWNVTDDLLKVGYSRDVCCNLSAVFELRKNRLSMTVFNRSNDMIWGLLGANYVHFTILQEYIAAHLYAEMGVYHHITTNLHVYKDVWDPAWAKVGELGRRRIDKHFPLVQDYKVFNTELPLFVDWHKDGDHKDRVEVPWREPFLAFVANPMFHAFHAHKQRDYESAEAWVEKVEAGDWKTAAKFWIWKRREMWMAKQESTSSGS